MARDSQGELDELDKLLADPDLLGDDEEIELVRDPSMAVPRASREGLRAIVDASPVLVANVHGAREACQSARDALARARDEIDSFGAIEDPRTVGLLAWLACMDELLKFADNLGELLSD